MTEVKCLIFLFGCVWKSKVMA